jgi:hypothetical protein
VSERTFVTDDNCRCRSANMPFYQAKLVLSFIYIIYSGILWDNHICAMRQTATNEILSSFVAWAPVVGSREYSVKGQFQRRVWWFPSHKLYEIRKTKRQNWRTVINLTSLLGNTNQKMSLHGPLNTVYQVPWRSKHTMLTGHTHREPYLNI